MYACASMGGPGGFAGEQTVSEAHSQGPSCSSCSSIFGSVWRLGFRIQGIEFRDPR